MFNFTQYQLKKICGANNVMVGDYSKVLPFNMWHSEYK